MCDTAYENLNSKFLDNQDVHDQIENDETGQLIYSEDTEPTEQSPQVYESNLALGDFMPKITTDDEIVLTKNSL